jgi:MFS transporter, ceroid-lipofuscinosis neuronal protein 7
LTIIIFIMATTNEATTPQVTSSSTAIDLLSGGQEDAINYIQQQRQPAVGSSNVNYVAMEMAKMDSRHGGGDGDNDDYKDDDDDNDDDAAALSIVSSVLTADGIHDVRGFLCVCFVILLGDMSRGVMFPSMWPLVESLGGTQVLLGYAVAAFSFGRVLVNPLFGAWSHSMGYTKTLTLSICILMLGTLMYAQVPAIGRLDFLIVAQTVLGIGSGTLGVTRAFVADVTATRSRTTYMAWMTAVQYGGFTVTPIVGAWFNYMLQDNDIYLLPNGWVRLNMYTAPAYFMFVLCLITLVILSLFFKDRHRIATSKEGADLRKSTRRAAIEDYANSSLCGWCFGGGCMTVFDCCIMGCMLLNVATKGSIASFETLGIAVAQSHFDMTSSRAGAIVAACGAVGVMTLLSMGRLERHMSDVHMITAGIILMIAGISILVPIKEDVVNPPWRYATAIFLLYGIGYPLGHTAVIGLFSKSKYLHGAGKKLHVCCWLLVFLYAWSNDIFLSFVCLASLGSTTTRRAARLVCISWVLGSHDFPHHVGIHFELQRHRQTV